MTEQELAQLRASIEVQKPVPWTLAARLLAELMACQEPEKIAGDPRLSCVHCGRK